MVDGVAVVRWRLKKVGVNGSTRSTYLTPFYLKGLSGLVFGPDQSFGLDWFFLFLFLGFDFGLMVLIGIRFGLDISQGPIM